MLIMPNRKISAMRLGKRFTSMFLRWRTGPETACFIIKKPGVSICSRNDGLRPVIFKLEATDEESKINLHVRAAVNRKTSLGIDFSPPLYAAFRACPIACCGARRQLFLFDFCRLLVKP